MSEEEGLSFRGETDRLTALTAVGTGLAASLAFYFCLADTLPFGADSAYTAECVFGARRGVPVVWGLLVRLCWTFLHGAPAFRLGVVSALAGGIAAGAVAFSVRRAFMWAVANTRDDSSYSGTFLALVGPVAAFFFASMPEVFTAATHVGPYAVQLALAMLAIALTFGGIRLSETDVPDKLRTLAVGFVAGLSAVEGTPGLVAFPLVVARTWFDSVKRRQMSPTVVVAWFALGFALAVGLGLLLGWSIPTRLPGVRLSTVWLFLAGAVATLVYGVVRRWSVTGDAFVVLAVTLAIAGVQTSVCVRRSGTGRAADEYVRGLVKEAEGRRWLVSDGVFDALLRFYLPSTTHLVTFGRESDRAHGEEIARWVHEERPEADDDLLLVADLGPSRFVEFWMTRPDAATNCVFATVFEPPAADGQRRSVSPLAFCWRPEAGEVDAASAERRWRDAWSKTAPHLQGRDRAADLIRCRFSAHGNAVGTLLQETGQKERAWATYAFVRKEVDRKNLSLLLNMDEMARRGLAGDDAVAKLVAKEVRTEFSDIKGLHALRNRLAEGGRLFVPQDVRSRLTENVRARQRAFWETPSGQLLRLGLDRLEAVEKLKGKSRLAELDAIAKATRPALDDRAVAAWVKDLFLGQLAQLRGGAGLIEAQRRYQSVVDRGEGDVKLAFNRLLAVDMALGDKDTLENDALRILRREPGHALASALVGSTRLMRGESASALRFLRNAERLGLRSAAVLNDMALALSRLGRHDEALAAARRAVEADPKNPHVRATLDEVSKNMKKTE